MNEESSVFENIITTIVMLTPGILASKTYRLLTRHPQAVTETYKAPEILLFSVIVYGIGAVTSTNLIWTHIAGVVIGIIAAQLAFLTSQAKWKDRCIFRHIKNRSLIPTWYSSFLAGDGKWWQIERVGKREPIVCHIVEWPSNPKSGYYRIKAVSGGRDHRKGGEYLIPANTIELLEIRDDSEETPSHNTGGDGQLWQIERQGKPEPIVCHIVEWPRNPASGCYRIKAVSEGRDHRKGGEYLIPANTIELLEIRDDSGRITTSQHEGGRSVQER